MVLKKKVVTPVAKPPVTTPVKPTSTSYTVGSNTPKQSILTAQQRGINIPSMGSGNRTGTQSQGSITNASPTPVKPTYGTGNPASGYSGDDYRTPLYGSTPTGMAPITSEGGGGAQAPAQSPFDMSQFTSMFDGMSQQNDARFSALEKMLSDMVNANKYKSSIGQNQQGQQQGIYDGTHQFTAPGQGKDIGYTQNNDAMNQTLYKYLNGMWKGGF